MVDGFESTRDLLDEDVAGYSVDQWRQRDLSLFELLVQRDLVDTDCVSEHAVAFLVNRLIGVRVGAALDSQNAGHVRAQNENVVHFALAAGIPKSDFTIALVAGLVHDLNKAFREPLRTDQFAVLDADGKPVPVMQSLGEIVGLNHLGDRTRRALQDAVRLGQGALSQETADAIDHCIVHHGLGSSRFIRNLVAGANPWWGSEFVDPKTGQVKLRHPEQPPWTLASVVHDLADSAQQMQGGVAWWLKYPNGFWSGSGRSFYEMLLVEPENNGAIPLSLAHQIRVESETCDGILAEALAEGVLDQECADRLRDAVAACRRLSEVWLGRAPSDTATPESVFDHVAMDLSISVDEAKERLAAVPGTVEGDAVESSLWRSARRLDHLRAESLARVIHSFG